MGECRYSVRSGIPKFPSKAGELAQVFPGTITQPIGGTERRAIRDILQRSPTRRRQRPSDPVDRTISNLYVAREQLDDALAKIDKAIQDVPGLSVNP